MGQRTDERRMPLLVGTDEAAELLGLKPSTVRRWLRDGWMPEARVAHGYVWPRAELEEWVAAGCPPRAEWESMRRIGA